MKNILVPIDYSPASHNALKYAVEFAKSAGGKILLLHVYEIPVTATEMSVFIVDPEELEKENADSMKSFLKKSKEEFGNAVEFESEIRAGFATEEILNASQDNKSDFIILSLNGDGALKKITGSTSVSVMKRASCPVIVVPDNAKFQPIKKIVLACDYQNLKNTSVLEPLWNLAFAQGAEIMVFNVSDSRIHPSSNGAMKEIQLEHFFGRVKHSYWFGSGEDVPAAIDEFVKKHEAVMIAGIRQQHAFPENIFHSSTMKALAFQSHTPLFILHE